MLIQSHSHHIVGLTTLQVLQFTVGEVGGAGGNMAAAGGFGLGDVVQGALRIHPVQEGGVGAAVQNHISSVRCAGN